MRKLFAYFIALVGPAAVITAGTMGAGSTSSLVLAIGLLLSLGLSVANLPEVIQTFAN